jgi:hypothetical protein
MKMRFKLILFILFLKVGSALGQTTSYPKINTEGSRISDFIPMGWSLVDSVSGDFNRDSFDDRAFIIAPDDDDDNTYKRDKILVVVFCDTAANNYKLVEHTSKLFAPLLDKPNLFYEVMEVNKGVLSVVFMHAGSYATIFDYKFRYQNNEFCLIGADKQYANPTNYQSYSFNFISKRWSLTTSDDTSDEKPVTVWNKLESAELKTLKTFEGPYSWKVAKGVYL